MLSAGLFSPIAFGAKKSCTALLRELAPTEISTEEAYVGGDALHSLKYYEPTDRNHRDHLNHRNLPPQWLAEAATPRKNFREDLVIVDLGAGKLGSWVKHLRSRKIKAFAVDPRIAIKSQTKILRRGFAGAIPFRDSTVNEIYSMQSVFSMLYFRDNPDAYILRSLDEMARVLKSGGKARLGPFYSNPFFRKRDLDRFELLVNLSHKFEFRTVEYPDGPNGVRAGVELIKK